MWSQAPARFLLVLTMPIHVPSNSVMDNHVHYYLTPFLDVGVACRVSGLPLSCPSVAILCQCACAAGRCSAHVVSYLRVGFPYRLVVACLVALVPSVASSQRFFFTFPQRTSAGPPICLPAHQSISQR